MNTLMFFGRRPKGKYEHCCSKNYRVKDEKTHGVEDEKVKLRAKDSFHFNDTLDRNKRCKSETILILFPVLYF